MVAISAGHGLWERAAAGGPRDGEEAGVARRAVGIYPAGAPQLPAQHCGPLAQNRMAATVARSSWVQAAGPRAELTIWALCSSHQPCH